MRLIIPRGDLARLLSATTRVVEARNTIPILSTVRLVAYDGRLTITATDLDIEVTAGVDCEAAADGETCVDAKLLDDIVKKLPANADITIEKNKDNLVVKAGRSRLTLQVLPAEDFPSFSAGGFAAEFTTDLATLFAPVGFAISTEETRFYLNGIFLENADDKLSAVATDGHRLSRNETAIEALPAFKSIIVPRKTVSLVPKGQILVELSDTKIRLTAGDTVITSKLIDGTFPDYRRILPTGNDKIVTFSSPEMKQASDRVSVVSSERGRAVKLSFADGQAVLAVNNPEMGSATEEVAVSYDGDSIEIGFNARYLADVIGIFPTGDIKLALNDGGSPALLTSDAAPGLLVVLMPMWV